MGSLDLPITLRRIHNNVFDLPQFGTITSGFDSAPTWTEENR
jgi:hypothetical protein